jgi:hypothetical protein
LFFGFGFFFGGLDGAVGFDAGITEVVGEELFT